MTEQQMLLEMLDMQDEHNTTIHSDWRNQNYPYYRAIWVECAELLDHYDWKWWKTETTNKSQLTLELVDIWHFGLSDLLATYTKEHIVLFFDRRRSFDSYPHADIPFCVEELIVETLKYKTFTFDPFFRLASTLGVSFEELYKMYKAKNILNEFRQSHGYNDGTYQKYWDGKEDNDVLADLMSKKTSLKKLNAALEDKYPE